MKRAPKMRNPYAVDARRRKAGPHAERVRELREKEADEQIEEVWTHIGAASYRRFPTYCHRCGNMAYYRDIAWCSECDATED